MEVKHLLVDDLQIHPGRLVGLAKSIRYDFVTPTWVSARKERKGESIGPLVKLELAKEYSEINDTQIISFDDRDLVTEGPPAKLEFSFKDTWTIPAKSVYALVFPRGYVDTEIFLLIESDEGSEYLQRTDFLQLGVNRNNQLFYFTPFSEEAIIKIGARIVRDERKYHNLINNVEIVRNTNGFNNFYQNVVRVVKSSDFWAKLIAEIGVALLTRNA